MKRRSTPGRVKRSPKNGYRCEHPHQWLPTLSGGANGTSFAKESWPTCSTGISRRQDRLFDVRVLQVDNDGYFYYDCTQNFASFDQDSNSFTLYEEGAVHPGGTSKGWQFFPFDTAEEVLRSIKAGT